MCDPTDSLFDKRLVPILSRLGMFERDFRDDSGFGSNLWRKIGHSNDRPSDWVDQVHPEDRSRVEEAVRQIREGLTDLVREEYRVRTAEGEWHWVLSKGYVVTRDTAGRPLRYIGIDVDIHTQKVLEQFYQNAMEEAEERARETETLRRAGAIIASSLEIHQTVNLIIEQARNVIPYKVAAVLVREESFYEILGITGTDRNDMKVGSRFSVESLGRGAEVMADRQPLLVPDLTESDYGFEDRIDAKAGTIMGIPLVERANANGMLVFYHPKRGTFARDHMRLGISLADHVSIALQNARLFEQVRSQAATDPLTGLANRRAFFNQAQEMFGRLESDYGHITLLMVDLDYFKHINDTYGHQVGDRLLCEAADAIRSVVREHDVVGRYGGEEFAVLLRDVAIDAGMAVAERLAEAIRAIACPVGPLTNATEATSKKAPPKRLTASIGIAESKAHDAGNVLALVRSADTALYAAKSAGRDRIVVFDRTLSPGSGTGTDVEDHG